MNQHRHGIRFFYIALLTALLVPYQNCSNGYKSSSSDDQASLSGPPAQIEVPAGFIPQAPSALAATVSSSTQVQLSWTANSTDEQGFSVERATGSGPFMEIARVGSAVVTYASTNLTASTQYSFRVRAFNAAGNSAYSNAVNATTSADTTPTPVPTTKMVFMATGHMGRTVMSCDGGRTWIRDRSDNDATRCWVTGDPNYLECDHSASAGRGADAGDGYFFANFGWGFNGSVRRSRDGMNWQTVRTGGWGGGVLYHSGRATVMWDDWFRSADSGVTWTPVANSPASSISFPQAFRAGSVFIAHGRADGIALSRDQGETWERHPEFLQTWGGYFAAGNGLLVGAGSTGTIAYSSDNGVTWTTVRPQTNAWIGLVFDGTQFVGWSTTQVFRSADARTWTSAALTGVPLPERPIQYNPETRTFAMIPNNWDRYYSRQKAYYSTDGATWTEVSAAGFVGGHPIGNIVVGPMDASFCP